VQPVSTWRAALIAKLDTMGVRGWVLRRIISNAVIIGLSHLFGLPFGVRPFSTMALSAKAFDEFTLLYSKDREKQSWKPNHRGLWLSLLPPYPPSPKKPSHRHKDPPPVCAVLSLEYPVLEFMIRQRLRGPQEEAEAWMGKDPPAAAQAQEDSVSRFEARMCRRAKLLPGPLLAMECVSCVVGGSTHELAFTRRGYATLWISPSSLVGHEPAFQGYDV
jgi:hypothetical protein